MKNHDIDVLIIGAGVTGLSAAQLLEARHFDVCLIEASHRIGGRAYSEQFSNGSWFDLGCSYLHEGEINPFSSIAYKLGFKLGDGNRFDRNKLKMIINGKGANKNDLLSFQKFEDNFINTMVEMSSSYIAGHGDDMASAIDWNHKFAPLYSHLMSGLNASDVTDQSVTDYLKSGFGLDYPVVDGFGRLILAWAKEFINKVPCHLNCSVKEIDWSDGHIKVNTNKGSIKARKVLITVSTGVMNSGQIKFLPNLPEKIEEAFYNLPCGCMNKIGLSFLTDTFGEDEAGWHNIFCDQDQENVRTGSFDINIDDRQQAVVFVGGSESIYLERQGGDALKSYAVERIVEAFGSKIKSKINGHITTAWGEDGFTLGSYSYARPGCSLARQTIGKCIEELIYFAGEAASVKHFGTCHGAYLSGVESAEKIARNL